MKELSPKQQWAMEKMAELCAALPTYHSDDPLSVANNNIFTLYRDRKNRMWIGTFGGGLNLAIKEKDKYVFKRFLNNFYSQRLSYLPS